MSEAEVLQAAQAAWSNVLSIAAMQLTLLSGYLIVAYVVGRELSRSQVVIVNLLYLTMYGLLAFASYTFVMRAAHLMQYAVELSNQRLTPAWPKVAIVTSVVFVLAMVASLKFMWDIRHKGKEQ
jgi:hypothetical protein